jgi:hypothetical protein
MDSLNWTSILTSGLVVAILTTGANWLRDLWRDHSNSKKDATYLALRVAVILERFVTDCVYRVWDDNSDNKEGRDLTFKLPELYVFPADEPEWKSFHNRKPILASRVLSFPNEVRSAELLSQFQAHREGNPFGITDEIIKAGMNAWVLACDLRKAYTLELITIANLSSLEAELNKLRARKDLFESVARPFGPSVP